MLRSRLSLVVVFVMPALAVLCAGCSTPQPSPLEECLALFYAYDLTSVLPLLETAVERDPDNPEALAYLADTYRRLNRIEDAKEAAARALAADSCNGFAHVVLAECERRRHYEPRSDSDRAWIHLNAAVACDSTDGNAWMSLWNEAVLREKPVIMRQAVEALVRHDFLTPAVLTHARWLLRTLPDSAILITGGDMDTYPLLALQEAEGFRPDVAVAEQGLLNTAAFLRHLASRFAVPLPFDESLADSVAHAASVGQETPALSERVLEFWTGQFEAGVLHRPIAIAVTVEADSYSEMATHLSLAGPFFLWRSSVSERRIDTTAVRTSLDSITFEDLAGPWVAANDRSPARRLYTRNLAANITEAALELAEALIEAGRLDEAAARLDWAERLQETTELGAVLSDRIAELRQSLADKSR